MQGSLKRVPFKKALFTHKNRSLLRCFKPVEAKDIRQGNFCVEHRFNGRCFYFLLQSIGKKSRPEEQLARRITAEKD